MSIIADTHEPTNPDGRLTTPPMKLEVIVLPVTDVDAAIAFYTALGWKLDIDFQVNPDYRVVEFTPPGSATSIIFGTGVSDAVPGSLQGLHLVVSDIVVCRATLVERGVRVGEIFHDATGVFHHAGTADRVPRPAPDRRSYGSFMSMTDPEGNEWVVQEITQRIPGRITQASYGARADLASALRAAAAAHGAHEGRLGHEDANWPEWYADYLLNEQLGQPLPG